MSLIKFIICSIIGHEPYEPHILKDKRTHLLEGGTFITLFDALGIDLCHVKLCKRCQLVYWERV